ncbi:MAG: hypothetical protein ABIK86_05415 [candidate division WOR-3 bacterium]
MHMKRYLLLPMTATLFLLAGCTQNLNPDTPPPPLGPSLSRVGTTCRFKITARDPDFDQVSVRVDWDDGDTTDWTEPFRSGDTVTLEHVWATAREYKVSARARDENGALSLWSNWHEITIEDTVNLAPGTPTTPAGPDSGLVDSVYSFTTVTTDPNRDRVRYRMSWGDGDTTVWSDLIPENTEATFTHSWALPGVYLIQAQARDDKGLESGWTTPHVFVVTDSLR